MKTIVIAALVLVSAATVAFSEGGDRRGARELGQFLKLTAGQQAAWDAAHNAYTNATSALIEKRAALGRQGEAQLKERSPDACAIGRVMITMQGIGDQLRTEDNTLQQKITSMLTADQKLKLEAFRAGQQAERMAGD